MKHHDKELSTLIKEGDLRAYNDLFNNFYGRLYNFALKITNDESQAKDLVQDTFIKLWYKREKINIELSISSYLFKICKNEFLDSVRQKNKEKAFLDEIKIEMAYQMYLEPENEEEVSKIQLMNDAISKLPPKCKEAFTLSKYENMTYKDIAERMGISVKTVETHITKAYKELRKELKTIPTALFFMFM